jgi:hypothetical protein
MCRKIGGEKAASLTKTNPRSSEEPLGHRLAVRDIRFAGLVAIGLVGGVLAIGALASPMLGWSGSTATVLPEHEQTVRLAEPAAAARSAGVAPGPSEPQRRTARRERRRQPEPRSAGRVENRKEVGLQPAASATPEPAGVEPKPATVRRTSLRSRRTVVAVPDLRAPRWRLPSRPAAGGAPPPDPVEGSPQPADEPPAEPPPTEARPPAAEPTPDRPPEAPLIPERPSPEGVQTPR